MATLNLTKTWVNLMSTGAAVSAQAVIGRSMTNEIKGETKVYAGGRVLSVVAEGNIGVYPVALLLVPEATYTILDGWKGNTVMVRDSLGNKVIGVYYRTAKTEFRGRPGSYTVTFEVNVVSYDEGV